MPKHKNTVFSMLFISCLKLFRCVMTCNIKYTFLSIYIFIFDSIFNFRWKSVTFFIFCALLLRLFLRYSLKAIWKFRHWYLSISIDTAKMFWKDKTFMTNTALVLIYLAPVSLCYNHLFLYDLFFFHPQRSMGVLEKSFFEFLEHPSISI